MRLLTSDEVLRITSLDEIVDYWVRLPQDDKIPNVIAQFMIKGTLTWRRKRMIYFRGVINHDALKHTKSDFRAYLNEPLKLLYIIGHAVTWHELTTGLPFLEIADYHYENRVLGPGAWTIYTKLATIEQLSARFRAEQQSAKEKKEEDLRIQAELQKAAAVKKLLIQEDNDMSWNYDEGL